MFREVIGFIGQGFIGKHMADDFENRGYSVVRYALEKEYVGNKQKLKSCDIIFIAVPTPTKPDGFDLSIVRAALAEVPEGATAVIKSTIVPGSTEKLQNDFPNITVMHSPEFLRETSAAEDTAKPERNIVGIPKDTPAMREHAQRVLGLLTPVPYSIITLSVNAECIKYIGNAYLYTKVVFMNLMYDFVRAAGGEWDDVRDAVIHDNRIGSSHSDPVHDTGRGAGGHCFIKDFEALLETFRADGADAGSVAVLESLRAKNNQLLLDSNKNLDLLRGVYGDNIPSAS